MALEISDMLLESSVKFSGKTKNRRVFVITGFVNSDLPIPAGEN